MRISFRHGLIHTPPGFLSLSNQQVSIILPPDDKLTATIADGTTNYLLTELTSVTNAWTGPFIAGQDYWLYWDIDLITGEKVYGFTSIEPIVGSSAPITPIVNQHWFDTSSFQMKQWNGSRWVKKVRLFVAKLDQGAVFVSLSIDSPLFTGTQIGITGGSFTVGSILFDGVNGYPIKKNTGEFFTTEDSIKASVQSVSQVKLGSLVVEAEAVSNLAAYTMVRFSDFNKIDLATDYVIDNGLYGIIDTNVTVGEITNVIIDGKIENPDWDWTSVGVNAPLYVNNLGQLTEVPPANPVVIATVVDTHTILLRPSSLVSTTTNDPSTTISLGSVLLSVDAANPNLPIVVGTNDPRIVSVSGHISDQTVHLTPDQNTLLDSFETLTDGIMVYNSTTGEILIRSLDVPAEGLAISDSDGISGNPTLALSNDLLAIESLTTTGIAARTTDDTWTTRSIDGTTDVIDVVNGDGIADNPTISISSTYAGQSSISVLGTIDTGTWNGDIVTAEFGGTGLSTTGTVNQLIGVSTTDTSVFEYKTLAGTTNQVTVTPGVGTYTLSTPQDLDTAATVQFGIVNANQHTTTEVILTDAVSIEWDMLNGTISNVTITDDRAMANPTNIPVGSIVILKVYQDVNGLHTLSFGSAFKWADNTPPVISTAAGSLSVFSFVSDGTNLYEISRTLNVA